MFQLVPELTDIVESVLRDIQMDSSKKNIFIALDKTFQRSEIDDAIGVSMRQGWLMICGETTENGKRETAFLISKDNAAQDLFLTTDSKARQFKLLFTH